MSISEFRIAKADLGTSSRVAMKRISSVPVRPRLGPGSRFRVPVMQQFLPRTSVDPRKHVPDRVPELIQREFRCHIPRCASEYGHGTAILALLAVANVEHDRQVGVRCRRGTRSRDVRRRCSRMPSWCSPKPVGKTAADDRSWPFRVPFGVPPLGSGTDEKLEVEPLQLGKRALPYRPCP